MLFRSWAAWFRTRTSSARRPRRYRPELEGLEARVVQSFNTMILTNPTVGVRPYPVVLP